jgi:hypothetical protein
MFWRVQSLNGRFPRIELDFRQEIVDCHAALVDEVIKEDLLEELIIGALG